MWNAGPGQCAAETIVDQTRKRTCGICLNGEWFLRSCLLHQSIFQSSIAFVQSNIQTHYWALLAELVLNIVHKHRIRC